MFAVICLPDFALQALLRHEPGWRAQPVALIDGTPAHAAKALVLECTEKARAAGVGPGLTAPQAQARCGDLLLKLRSPPAEQSATDILLQTVYAFSPNIEDTAPGVCTIDLRGLNFGGEQSPAPNALTSPALRDHTPQQSFEFFREGPSCPPPANGKNQALLLEWARKILAAVGALNLHARIGLAETPNMALLAARAAKPLLMVECAEAFLALLPIGALEPSPALFNILQRWGIHTAGAFLALGRDAVAERLGAEALALFERAGTQTIRPLRIVVPADTFAEQVEFEVHIETSEPLLFVLRRFVEQLATRIALTYRVVAELQLTLTLESGPPYERTFKVPAPTAQVETLFRMLHTHLENLRTDAAITSLRLSATPAHGEAQQFGLFESALRDPNHFHETLARLTALLGPERVGAPVAEATHHPDALRMQTPAFDHDTTQNLKLETHNPSSLCLRRFRPALHADVELENGRPIFLSTLVVSGTVKCARGPWRTSGTWWDQRRWSRQEWDVETRDGAVYRLFHTNGDWRVEGVYD